MYELLVEHARDFDPALRLCEISRGLALGYKLFLGDYSVVLHSAMNGVLCWKL